MPERGVSRRRIYFPGDISEAFPARLMYASVIASARPWSPRSAQSRSLNLARQMRRTPNCHTGSLGQINGHLFAPTLDARRSYRYRCR